MIIARLIKQHTQLNNRFFDKFAPIYDLEKFFLFPLRKKAVRFLSEKPVKKIVDVATGTGAQAYELAKQGHEVIGVDVSTGMLNQAKKKIKPNLKLTFQKADGTNLPFKNHAFDVATISMALHDMPLAIAVAVLKEMKRVVKSRGKLLIVDYLEPENHWLAKIASYIIRLYETEHYLNFINNGLETLLKEAKLKIKKKTIFLGTVQLILVEKIK